MHRHVAALSKNEHRLDVISIRRPVGGRRQRLQEFLQDQPQGITSGIKPQGSLYVVLTSARGEGTAASSALCSHSPPSRCCENT